MLDYDALKTWALTKTQSYTERDTMLYALGVGLGADPFPAGIITVHRHDLVAETAAKAVDDGRCPHLRPADREGREDMQHPNGAGLSHWFGLLPVA